MMNMPHDPNVTADLPPVPADSPRSADPLATTDRVSGSDTTAAYHPADPPGADASARDLPAIPGYRVLREIARGGMGRVLAAHDLHLDRDVALKILLPGANADRFVRESKITARLPHPGIPPVHALGTLADGSPFLAMKLIVGHTLAVELKTADRPRLLQAFMQVCQAVGFAHSQGVVHRDLKPANVMVGAFGEVQVMDWGLAKDLAGREIADEPRSSSAPPVSFVGMDADQTTDHRSPGESTDAQTQTGTVLGTPAYMAPEVAAGHAATTAADVYGLGSILYALLVGRAPYSGANVAEVLKLVTTTEPALFAAANSSVPRALVAICRKTMARNPEARYPSAEDVATDVQRWLADEPVSVYREPWTARTARWAKRRKSAVIAAAVLLLTTAIAASAAAVLVWREQQQTKTEWQRAEGEKVKATENADTAIAVVHDLSEYIKQVEQSGGKTLTDKERKQTLDTALASYEKLLALNPDDSSLQEHMARTHRYRANMCRLLRDTAEAEKSYGKARHFYGELAKNHPHETRFRGDLALTARDFALFLRSLDRLNEAAEILDGPIRYYDDLLRSQPERAEFQRLSAMLSFDRAELDYQLCRSDDSERQARRSAELYGRLAGNTSASPEPLDGMFRGMAEIAQAQALRELGRIDEALAVHDIAVKRLNELAKASNTRDNVNQFYHAKAERAWTSARAPERIDEGIADLNSVIDGWEKLAKLYPQTPAYVRSQGRAALYRGRLNLLRNRREAAKNDFVLAAQLMEVLVKKYPDTPTYRSFLGQAETALGQIETDPRSAVERYRKARELLEAAIKQSPENALFRQALSELDALTKSLKP